MANGYHSKSERSGWTQQTIYKKIRALLKKNTISRQIDMIAGNILQSQIR